MRKRIMALLGASAIVALIFAGTPAKAVASTTYDWYVNTNADTGSQRYGDNTSCRYPADDDLQDVLNIASEGETIMVCKGWYYGPFHTENDITLVGAGAKATIIDGSGDGDPAILAGYDCEGWCAVDLTISKLTITNGYSDWETGGGAVYADHFDCSNSVISNSYADVDGGAVFAYSVESSGCTYKDNTAEYDGGAIKADWMTSSHDTFINNEAGDDGGAVELDGDSEFTNTFDRAQFTSNTACEEFDDDCAESWAYHGGAIHVFAGSDDLYITNSTFTDNSAASDGGAVYGVYVNIQRSKFVGNYADSDGGGVHARGDLDIYSSTFISNGSWCSGSAFYTEDDLWLANTKFSGNYVEDCDDWAGYVEDQADLLKGSSKSVGWYLPANAESHTEYLRDKSQRIYVSAWDD